MSLGGTSLGIRTSSFVNHSNPASYTAIDTTSFVFDGGVYAQSSTLKTTSASQTGGYSSLGSVLFGFPISKRIKASFGLMPFTNVGYKISDPRTITYSADSVIKVNNIYDGSGGINKAYLGFGYYISHNLSIGVNADFLFGTINRNSTSYYPDLTYANSYRQTTSIKVNDFNLNFGLQYTAKIGKDKHFTLGVVYSPAANIKASNDTLANMVSATDPETVLYTLRASKTNNGKISIPESFGAGFAFERDDKFLLAGDFKMQNWTKLKMFEVNDSLKNSWRGSLGLQIIPNSLDYNSYFKRVRYRFGLEYNNTYLQMNGKQLTDFGFSFGAGFPVRKSQTDVSRGMVNVAIEIGKRGTTNSGLISENYFRFTLSVAIYDFWFRKQKYY